MIIPLSKKHFPSKFIFTSQTHFSKNLQKTLRRISPLHFRKFLFHKCHEKHLQRSLKGFPAISLFPYSFNPPFCSSLHALFNFPLDFIKSISFSFYTFPRLLCVWVLSRKNLKISFLKIKNQNHLRLFLFPRSLMFFFHYVQHFCFSVLWNLIMDLSNYSSPFALLSSTW